MTTTNITYNFKTQQLSKILINNEAISEQNCL